MAVRVFCEARRKIRRCRCCCIVFSYFRFYHRRQRFSCFRLVVVAFVDVVRTTEVQNVQTKL